MLLAPALTVFVLFRLVPMLWNLVLSFSDWAPGRPLRFIGLDHYEEMLIHDDVFAAAIKNTMIYIASMPLAIAIALGIALLVNAPIRGRNAYRTIVFLSYPLMAVVVAVIWRWLYDEKVGLFNFLLRSAGLISQPVAFLDSTALALPSVIAAAMWQLVGFFMIILLTGLQSIPQHLYEAAAIDGASRLQAFRRVTAPLMRPWIFLCLIIGIVSSFTKFDLIYVMTQGGPGRSTELLITYIYKSAFKLSELAYAAALTVVMFSLFLALTFILNRLSGGEAGKTDVTY